MHIIRPLLLAFTVLMMTPLQGCMKYTPEFIVGQDILDAPSLSHIITEADQCTSIASNHDKLQQCMTLYDRALQHDAGNYHALTMLSNLHLLSGDGYVSSTREKAAHFRKALSYSENAMYQNGAFRERIDRGEPVWEACTSLTAQEIDAMVFWVTAVFYYYKECFGPVGQMVNYHWINRAKKVLTAAGALDPDWGGGIIHLSWALYYLSIPEVVGGNREKSAHYFSRAIATGPNRLLNRWARGKYYAVKMGKKQIFLEDLNWVVEKSTERAEDNGAWIFFFKADASSLLQQQEKLF